MRTPLKSIKKSEDAQGPRVRPRAIVLARRFFSILSRKELAVWWIAFGFFMASSAGLLAIGAGRNIGSAPTFGGEYTEALVGFPQNINPLFAPANEVDRDIVRLVFAGIVKPVFQGDTLAFVPDLAKSVTVSGDQKTYTVTMKPGLRWQDGEPLTADDVLFTIESIQNPDWKSPLAVSFRGSTLQKTDERTIAITLPEPFSPFLQALTVGILPKHLWKNVLPPNARLAELNIKPIGAGPFRFQSVKKDKDGRIHSYTFERNPLFHERLPYLDRITLRFYETPEKAFRALQTKEVEGMSYLPKQFRPEVAQLAAVSPRVLRLPQYTAMFFNQQSTAALRDPLVREALSRSVNRDELLKAVLSEEGELINGPILPGSVGHDAELQSPDYSLEKAAALLDAAGWKQVSPEDWKKAQEKARVKQEGQLEGQKEGESTQTAEATPPLPSLPYYRIKKNEQLKLTITAVDQHDPLLAAQSIAAAWRSIGIDADVRAVAGEQIQPSVLANRSFDVLLYGQIVGSDPDPYPFWHSSQIKSPGLNLAQFSDKKIDALLEQARKLSDQQARAGIFKEFQRLLVPQLPAIFLYRPTYTYLLSAAVQGMDIEEIAKPADRWNAVNRWHKKTKWTWKK